MDANDADGLCFPYDLLLGILRRLRGRALARSRCVCRVWRAVVDSHDLLLPHVFPRNFPGVYTTYSGCPSDCAFFAPPASRSSCHQLHDADEPGFGRPFIWGDQAIVQQHCNGLLLLRDRQYFSDVYVCNPTTRRCARLPHPPTPWPCDDEGMFLAFDPAVSRHHQVFLFPREKLPPQWQRGRVKIKPRKPWWTELFTEGKPTEKIGQQKRDVNEQIDSLMPFAEAPKEKVVCMLVFSSITDLWESQEFVPGRCVPWNTYSVETTQGDISIEDMELVPTWWSAEYWRGSLYVHCHIGVLMIMRVTEGKYDTVQLPRDPPDCDVRMGYYNGTLPKRSILANNERGIFYVVLNVLQLHVWALSDSLDSQLGWTLAHKTDMNAQYHMIDQWGFKPVCTFEPVCTWEVIESKEELLSLLQHESSEESDEEYDEFIDGEEDADEEEEEEGDNEHGEDEEEEEENDGEDDEIVDGVAYHLGHKSREESDEEDDEIIDGEEDEDEEEEAEEDDEQGEDEEEEEENDSDCETREQASTDGSEHSWNSDEHNFVELDGSEVKDQDHFVWEYGIIGFHPHKYALLLCANNFGVAYHLDTSRMQYLGHIMPRQHIQAACMHNAFPYRSCYVDALPVRKTTH
ncbi:hypothetical protein VPH35_087080 [Triticum aestivum]